jgi:hypothetical protein
MNWLLEGVKFYHLMNKKFNLKIVKSFAAIFCGITVSNFTPARTGEYVGRMTYLDKKDSLAIVSSTMFGNAFQAITTYTFGILAILISGNYFLMEGKFTKLIVAILSSIILIIILLNSKKLLTKVKLKWLTYVRDKMAFLNDLTKKDILIIWLLSIGRYLAFSLQFLLLLFIFSDQWLSGAQLFLIPLVYMMQSMVPVPAIADVGVRIYVSQLVFGALFTSQEILFTVTTIWFVNLILPAFIGLFIFIFKWFRKWSLS